MSSLTTWFGWNVSSTTQEELPDIFPMAINQKTFTDIDVVTTYSKILTDVVERVNGLADDQAELLWDSCLMSSSKDGLITMLAKAMYEKKDLFLVYDKAINVVREATVDEAAQIREDYKSKAESPSGVYVSFKNYVRTDVVKLYSGFEFCAVSALNKSMNLSKAIQLKMSDLRASTGAVDAAEVRTQAVALVKGLGDGKDILLDAKDSIATSVPDLTSVEKSIAFLDSKRSFYLGLPASYINGQQTGGIGSTGESDTKAVERGLKSYYFSIVKPVLEAIFGVTLTYKSQDFRQIGQALEAMKTFDLVSEDYLTMENKKKIVEGLLDIQEEENQTTPQEPVPPPEPIVTPPPELPRGQA